MLAILLFIGMSYQFSLWMDRPIFRNSFGPHHRAPVLYWRRELPYSDTNGNVAIADYNLNMLVVFLISDSDIHPVRFAYPQSEDGGVRFPALVGEDELEFFTPIRRNSAFIFMADATRHAVSLPEGKARSLYESIRHGSLDLEVLVRHLREPRPEEFLRGGLKESGVFTSSRHRDT